ncbi:MAG TPA: RNA-binding cell elongation regulator Jag/EloR [Syntrophales bacterium]|nr:RNA-binding cell elongation regulator Jag/EloR [Syntrophales bacterium]
MESLEIEGKTIDEAIEKACGEFGVSREKLNIEIISDGASGFLGLGSKKAKIRASLLSIDMTIDTPPELSRQNVQKKPSVIPEPNQAVVTEESAESPAVRAKKILEGILIRMSLDCPVTIEETPDAIILNIKGDGSGLLIGKRGQNLDAIQYIVNKAVSKYPDNRKMIVVDTEGYRKRREESLIALAANLAEKVKKTKKSLTVGHMNAHDRRIIHLALQNDESLTTKSRGEGEFRKIVIMPVKKGRA